PHHDEITQPAYEDRPRHDWTVTRKRRVHQKGRDDEQPNGERNHHERHEPNDDVEPRALGLRVIGRRGARTRAHVKRSFRKQETGGGQPATGSHGSDCSLPVAGILSPVLETWPPNPEQWGLNRGS